MFNIGPGELIVILILALVLLGPDKLPEVARSIGKGMKELRRATEDIRNTVEQEIYRADLETPAAPPPRAPLTVAQRLPPATSETVAVPSSAEIPGAVEPQAFSEAPSQPSSNDQPGVHPAESPPSTKS
jgi:sec-independent protein translocase protein TatB